MIFKSDNANGAVNSPFQFYYNTSLFAEIISGGISCATGSSGGSSALNFGKLTLTGGFAGTSKIVTGNSGSFTTTLDFASQGANHIITVPNATGTMALTSDLVTLGTDNQIPIMNAGGTDFEYDSGLSFFMQVLSVGVIDSQAGQVVIQGSSGTGGGTLVLAVGGASDTDINSYKLRADSDNFIISKKDVPTTIMDYDGGEERWTIDGLTIEAAHKALPTAFYEDDFALAFDTEWTEPTNSDDPWTRDLTEGNGDSFSAVSGSSTTHRQESILRLTQTTTVESTLLIVE